MVPGRQTRSSPYQGAGRGPEGGKKWRALVQEHIQRKTVESEDMMEQKFSHFLG